ncbi:unnamed protein product [Rotaria socialis]|uniref:Uncharacterized protein n=1 Tax=Rotaria socialis TaxID=392032 RepID=A0A820EYZ7_9BILA|nr:unnamed protein product [Rotaria socialis]CAF3712996.1 unnamed protein product [Rotaria socialis]CAF4255844.1 unnamed protein product [Rotaria socialis]CAF4548610.1 unnamed protein product [Rotaria socialis]
MTFSYSIFLLLTYQIPCVWTSQCHHCNAKTFNHLITIDDLPVATEDDCNVIRTTYGCSIHIDWLADGTTEVYYDIKPSLPYGSILTITEHQVDFDTGNYSTRRSIYYSCKSKTTACNTIADLQRAINAIEFPTDEQIEQFNALIAPTQDFDGSSCFQLSNATSCSTTNWTNCRQCMITGHYSEQLDVCSTCRPKRHTRNFFSFETTFLLKEKSQSERIKIVCQGRNNCNSLENIERIRRKLPTQLDFMKFYRSTASTMKLTFAFLFTTLFTLLSS